MKHSSSDYGVFTWTYTGDDTIKPTNSVQHHAILCLATDDILMWTDNTSCFHRLRLALDSVLEYTFQDGPVLKFLNIRIVQSNHGISLDQTQHIVSNILDDYWNNHDTSKIPWQSAPFPTNNTFETTLFHSLPLTIDQHKHCQKYTLKTLE